MSYWISLNNPETGKPEKVDRFYEGGTQVVGGSTDAEINVTYNYGKFFPFSSLSGRKGKDCVNALESVIERLGTHQDDDYWAPTPGNAGHALNILLGWAKAYPNSVFEVH